MRKLPIVLSCTLMLSQPLIPLMQNTVYAAEITIQDQNTEAGLDKQLTLLNAQKEKLNALKTSKIGVPYKDLINVGFTAIETIISDATAIAKGEGIDPKTIYSLDSIGPRIAAIVEVIEAIDFSVNHLNTKITEAHTMMGLKTSHLVYTLLNPLASNSRINDRIKELQEVKKVALALPDLSPEDTATIYAKAILDKTIWETRRIRDKEILGKADFEIYHGLNKAITKAVGIQLDPKTKVFEIELAVKELQTQLSEALEGKVPTFVKRDRLAMIKETEKTLEDKQEQLEILREVVVGADYKDIVSRTLALVEKIGKEASPKEAGSLEVPLKVETIGSRIEALVTIIDGIVFATTEATNKTTDAHKAMGYTITKALIALSDPFSSQDAITTHVQRIIDLKEEIAKMPNLTMEDVATIYVKAKLDNAIWNTRFIRDREVLGKVPFDQYHLLNQAITKAVGIQLDPNTKVKDIDLAVKELQTALEKTLGREITAIVSEGLHLPEIIRTDAIVSAKAELAHNKEVLTKVSHRVMNEKYNQSLEEAFKLIDKIGGELDKVIEKDTIYPLGSIGTRMNALKTIVESIEYATTELRNKDITIHKDYGFNITRTLIALSDPHTSADKIQQRLDELKALKEKAANTPDLNFESRANLYVKSSLSKTIWETRFQRDREILGKQPAEVYHNLNKIITKAVGIQLNPNSTVAEVYEAINELESTLALAKQGHIEVPSEKEITPVVEAEETSVETVNDTEETTVNEAATTIEVEATTVEETTAEESTVEATAVEETTIYETSEDVKQETSEGIAESTENEVLMEAN